MMEPSWTSFSAMERMLGMLLLFKSRVSTSQKTGSTVVCFFDFQASLWDRDFVKLDVIPGVIAD